MAALRLEIDEELIEQIAARAAELVGERSRRGGTAGYAAPTGSPPTSTRRARASMRLSRPAASPSITTARR